MPEPVNSGGFRPRPVPPLVKAMYFSGVGWPSALQSVSPADRLRDCVVNRFGWNGVQSAMNCSDWAHVVFNIYQPGDNPFPTHASFRARRVFEGTVRVVPLAYLAGVVLPVDWPGGFSGAEVHAGQRVAAGEAIDVGIPVSDPPVVGRSFVPMLAFARDNDLTEVAVKVRYL